MLDFSHSVFAGNRECKLVEFLNAALQEYGQWPHVVVTSVESVAPPEQGFMNFNVYCSDSTPGAEYPEYTALLELWYCPVRGWVADFDE